MIRKILEHLKRKRLARKFGIPFRRRHGFVVPKELMIGEKKVPLRVPEEVGVVSNFLTVFMDDTYRLQHFAMEPKTILDIGANLGFFSLAARACFPNAMIHAYEPNAALEQYIRLHSEEGGFELFMNAVGLDEGWVSLELRGDSDLTRSFTSDDGTVRQIAFRSAIEKLGGSVDLAKIDCEGAEWQFFEDKEAWKAIHHVSMEYHLWPDHSHEEVRNVVRRLGFTIEKQIPTGDHGIICARR